MLCSSSRSSARRWSCAAILFAVLAWLPGCASWETLRGPGFSNEPKIGRPPNPLFPSSKGTGAFGYSTRSQQIERNLGIE